MMEMKKIKIVFTIIFFAGSGVLLTGCSKKDSPSSKQTSTNDSVKTIDSSSQAIPVKADLALTYEQRQGKNIYKKYCSVCHGDEGKGDGFNAFNLDPKPRDFTDTHYMSSLTDERIVQTITEGGGGVNRSILMPSWGGRLKKEEIRFVVSYLHTFASTQ
jgi:mono/diheme cytochrome c family protein